MDACANAVDQAPRRAERLAEEEVAAHFVERSDVSKCAADIRSQSQGLGVRHNQLSTHTICGATDTGRRRSDIIADDEPG
jgi:hypothetical protein